MAIDDGTAYKFQGKRLEDISVDGQNYTIIFFFFSKQIFEEFLKFDSIPGSGSCETHWRHRPLSKCVKHKSDVSS